MLLSVKNLSVSIESKIILKNLSLDINEGEVHAIMGPNGSGKSTFSNVLAGKEDYKIIEGEIKFNGNNLSCQAGKPGMDFRDCADRGGRVIHLRV